MSMKAEDLRSLFQKIAKLALGVDHEAYLIKNRKAFYGLGIDLNAGVFVPLFGNPPHSLLTTEVTPSQAGYSVGEEWKPHGKDSDVLLISMDHLRHDNVSDTLEALLLHEACHFVIETDQDLLEANANDKLRAGALLKHLRPDDPWHDMVFLEQLAVASRVLAGDDEADRMLRLAMSFDTYFDD